MNKIVEYLKQKKKILEEKQQKRYNCDVSQFYSDQLHSILGGIQVIIIKQDETISNRSGRGSNSHQELITSLLNILSDDEIFNKIGNFGQLVADKYGYVVFQMVNQYNGPTMINCPESGINDYQLSELKRINEEIKKFNENLEDIKQAKFIYEIDDEEIIGSLDNLIAYFKKDDIKKAV